MSNCEEWIGVPHADGEAWLTHIICRG